MSTRPPESSPFATAARGPGNVRAFAGSEMAGRWAALLDAAGVVAALAGVPPQPVCADERNFPHAMRDAEGWRRRLVEQGVDDLSVIMQTGIAALLAAHGRGGVVAPPARALWDEFVNARAALLALCPPGALARRQLA